MKGIRIGILVLIVGVVVALPPAASGSIIVHSSGPISFALFRQTDASGCVVTTLENMASPRRQTVMSGVGSSFRTDITAFITVLNFCEGTVDTFLGCFTSPGDPVAVAIDPDLTSATASGTITCTDFDTGATCTLSKSETLLGVGELSTIRSHTVRREDLLLINIFRAQTREAEVTEATITGCGFSFSEQDFFAAQFIDAVSTDVEIVR